jgi:tRNA G37 N-methylase Trm5
MVSIIDKKEKLKRNINNNDVSRGSMWIGQTAKIMIRSVKKVISKVISKILSVSPMSFLVAIDIIDKANVMV